jgi:hypothetical protein
MYAYGRASKKESYINRCHLCHYHLISSWRLGISVQEREGWKVDVLLLEPLEVAKGFTSMMRRAERPPVPRVASRPIAIVWTVRSSPGFTFLPLLLHGSKPNWECSKIQIEEESEKRATCVRSSRDTPGDSAVRRGGEA